MPEPLIAKVEYNHDCICSDVPERYPEVRIRYLAEIGASRRRISHLFNIEGDGLSRFIEAIKSHRTTFDVKVLRRNEHSADIIPTTREDASTRHAMNGAGCAFLSSPIYDSGVEMVHVFAPSFESLKGFLDSLKNSYNVKVVSKHFIRGNEKIMPDATERRAYLELLDAAGKLTTKQRRALKLASGMGYYEIPKRRTIREIAANMDISEAAASELLRKAEKKLIPALAKVV